MRFTPPPRDVGFTRWESHLVTTDSNGQATITFDPPFDEVPSVTTGVFGQEAGDRPTTCEIEALDVNGVTVRTMLGGDDTEVLGILVPEPPEPVSTDVYVQVAAPGLLEPE